MERVLARRMGGGGGVGVGGGGARQRQDNTPTQEHITHTDMSLTGHAVFAPSLALQLEQTVLVTETEKVT